MFLRNDFKTTPTKHRIDTCGENADGKPDGEGLVPNLSLLEVAYYILSGGANPDTQVLVISVQVSDSQLLSPPSESNVYFYKHFE